MNDPHRLLATGEALATEGELAKILGVSRAAMRPLLQRALGAIRYLRGDSPPRRYSVADARSVVEPVRAELEARRRFADARQAAEIAGAEARRKARAEKHAAHMAAKLAAARTVRTTGENGHEGTRGAQVILRRRPAND